MSSTSALIGAVIFAWLPEDENPYSPGPKFRPVIVLDYDPKQKRLLLAKGTSQRVNQRGRGEITFTTQEINGLTSDTKFRLGETYWVPAEKQYLSKNGETSGLTVLGRVPGNRLDDMAEALKEVRAVK